MRRRDAGNGAAAARQPAALAQAAARSMGAGSAARSGCVEHAATSAATSNARAGARNRASRVTRRPPGTRPCADAARRSGPTRSVRVRQRGDDRFIVDAQEWIAGTLLGQRDRQRRRTARRAARGPARCVARAPRCRASTVSANAQLASVYSCPQQTSVSPGSAARRSSDASICGRRAFEDAPAADAEERVAAEHDAMAVERDVAARVARNADHVEAQRRARKLDAIAVGDAMAGNRDALVVRGVDRNQASRRSARPRRRCDPDGDASAGPRRDRASRAQAPRAPARLRPDRRRSRLRTRRRAARRSCPRARARRGFGGRRSWAARL